jgi:hypothetical protein
MAPPALADDQPKAEKVTVQQLEQALAAAHGKPDAEIAQQISGMDLTERLSAARFARLNAGLPGDKARQALLILGDSATFLNPPVSEIPADAAPGPPDTRRMLTAIVNYVNTTARQLPNLMASRETTGFEDRPQEDRQGSTGLTTLIYLPLHQVGKSSIAVTYRDRKEVVDEKAMKHGPQIAGLTTSGEFGPILSRVVGDALQGKITWSRWEKGVDGTVAVFHYAVPHEKSNYMVQFCCVAEGFNSDGSPVSRVFSERAAYHGEIAFNPTTGAILRIAMEAEMPTDELVSKAGMLVEYAPVEIGGRSYICPVKSVSVLMAHTASRLGAYSMSSYKGQAKTFLNDVVFDQYRRFGTESRILAGDSEDTNGPSAPASAAAPFGAPSRAPTH